jgi:hypothetical protein
MLSRASAAISTVASALLLGATVVSAQGNGDLASVLAGQANMTIYSGIVKVRTAPSLSW